jgi:hypothetical protein
VAVTETQPSAVPVAAPSAPHGAPAIWERLDGLLDRAPGEAALRSHGVHLLGARRLRELGRPVSQELEADGWTAAILTLVAPTLLERVREACDGPLVLMKGPEVAARYPDPALRSFRDVDLLVPDAPAVQRQLVAAGFEPVGVPEKYAAIHHLRPLAYPGLPLLVEIHDRPKWPARLRLPAKTELLASAVPASVGVDGIDTLDPARHALVLAAHACAHGPLTKLGHALDVALLAGEVPADELRALARWWDLERLWRTSTSFSEALFGDGRIPLALRVWGRCLPAVRERRVVEAHLEDWLSPFSVYPRGVAAQATLAALADEFRPLDGETWRTKARRAGRAVRHAFAPLSDHRRELGPPADDHERREP